MKHKLAKVWVDDAFRIKLKQEALDNNIPVVEFTRRLSTDSRTLEEQLKGGKNDKVKFPRFF